MTITAGQVPVSTTAVALNPADTGASGGTIVVRNTHATDTLVVGASDVTAGTGYRIPAGGTLTVELVSGDRLYGIRGASNDITADVLRID